jgi:16S rRNA (adenine1518-N6/adenine1519-N6)-dimethyltransferase
VEIINPQSSTESPRQTLSYLRTLFEERGIKPKNKLGQNFLIDLNVLDVMVAAAELAKDDLVVEVGSGTGSLTARLCDQAGAVLSVEIDPAFYEMVRELLHARDNLVLLRADVLKNKNEIRPEVFEQIEALRQRFGCSRVKLVANLPYAVAVPVISNFLLSELPTERLVVMVQWEIAERLMARPGTKDYGALSVLVQSLADVTPVRRRLPPVVFWPRPQVASAIVMVRPNPAKRARVVEEVGSVGALRNFLRDLYVHRRKNLRGALVGAPSGRRPKDEVDRKLAELGTDGTVRAEDLDPEQHLRLCRAFGGGNGR